MFSASYVFQPLQPEAPPHPLDFDLLEPERDLKCQKTFGSHDAASWAPKLGKLLEFPNRHFHLMVNWSFGARRFGILGIPRQ